MRINVAALEKAGINVRIYDRKGRDEIPMKCGQDVVIELWVEGGTDLPKAVTDGIKEVIASPAFANATIEELHKQVHTLQVMQTIMSTEDK